jgi:hypothetical protein
MGLQVLQYKIIDFPSEPFINEQDEHPGSLVHFNNKKNKSFLLKMKKFLHCNKFFFEDGAVNYHRMAPCYTT